MPIMDAMSRQLTDPWMLGPLEVPNRVLLAPLAGIGNWFVRLQAKRYGAGMAVSEMVSSHAIHHQNERTCNEMLRIHPDERTSPGPWRPPGRIDPAVRRGPRGDALGRGARGGGGGRRDRHQHGLPGAEGAEDRRRRRAAGRPRSGGRRRPRRPRGQKGCR